ncbi:putative repeat protein (TIGR01451 family)/LPXTG-motif cell wall-anchored protein [Marmoricola sp. URHA0025 HA25]
MGATQMNKHSSSAGPTGFGWVRSLLAFRHQSPLGRLVSIIAAFAAALLLVGANVVPAQAAPVPCPVPGSFEIDGDMTEQTCNPGADDWNTPSLTVAQTTQGGTYKTAGKDDSDPSAWESSGSTPDKTDFERAYATSRVVNGHYFVYVAWERTNTTGTQGYAIEIDNSAANTGADGTPQPNRSHGTAVVYISSQGSAAPAFDGACTFTSQSDYGQTCTNSNANVTFAINTATIADPLAGTNQPAGSFFEVALDVTGLTGITPSCPGAAANSVYLRSITGQTHNGNLKGYMAPLTVAPDSTCATPTITTQTQTNPQIDGLDVVAPGTAQHDVATVTGTQAHPAPTGSVAFWLCGPTGSPADCTTGGVSGGSNPLTQHASNSTAQSDDLSPTVPGVYCWRAAFTPSPVNSDNPFLAATATTHANECFEVAYAHPSISTISSANTASGAATGSVGFTTLGDTATLSGVVPGADLSSEHVTFTLYGPGGSAPADASGCLALTAVSGPDDVALTQVNATTWHASAPSYEPTAADGPGFYTWVASYGGDTINHSVAGACNDANETQELVGPELTLDKGTPHSTINAGENAVYDINLANIGAGTASGVVVTDVLPILAGGGTWSLDGTSGYDCSIAAGTGGNAGHQVVTCDVGDLDPAASVQIAEVTATTTADDCGVINNQASIAADPEFTDSTALIPINVQCPGLNLTKTADHETVDAGSPIGFTITASNTGAGTATGALVHDVLPTGVSWSIDSDNDELSCLITAGVLDCTGELPAGGTPEIVHITAPTTFADCGIYNNHVTLTATNSSQTPFADASTTVLCSHLTLTKTADAATVFAGGQIGFTVTASNLAGEGVGTAHGVVINDPLPGGAGVDWSIAPGGPSNCAIQGSPSSETLHCTGVDLAPGASEAVHVISGTTSASCQAYPNVATLTSGNAPTLTANATATVTNCIIVSPPVQQPHPHVLPNTGGPNGWLFAGGLALLLSGGTLVLSDQRRRRRS